MRINGPSGRIRSRRLPVRGRPEADNRRAPYGTRSGKSRYGQQANGVKQGLLQLTYMDKDRYGCDFDWEHDKTLPEKDPAKTILNPRNNLLCGVKIMENQMITQRKPLLSPSSYWVTLQPAHTSYLMFAKQMKNVPAACRQGPPMNEARTKHRDSRTATAAAVPSP